MLLHLLLEEALEIDPTEEEMLQGLDLILKSLLEPGDFIWEADLAASFPRQEYWYLFGSLPERARE